MPGFEGGVKQAKEKVRPNVDVNGAAHLEKDPEAYQKIRWNT